MNVNLDIARTAAAQNGLSLQFVIKEFHVFNVLSQISMQKDLTQQAIFKGGTALNKIYLGKLQRFSEDLDFDSGTQSIAETKEYGKQLAEKLSEYEIKEFRRVKKTIQFYCKYDSQLGTKDHVRVDIAAKQIITTKPPASMPAISQYTGSVISGPRVYALEDLVARKMHALADRTEGKDVYDVATALPLCGKMANAIEKALEAEGKEMTVKQFLEKNIQALKKVIPKKMAQSTNSFIPTALRPRDWLEFKNDLTLKLEKLT